MSQSEIEAALDDFVEKDKPAVFTTGFVNACPKLKVGQNIIAPPYSLEKVQELYEAAEQSPVGTVESTEIRLDVRSSKEIKDVEVLDPWPLEDICEEVRQKLAPGSTKVTARPYKLLLYKESDYFMTHQDAQFEANMFASLLVFLPIPYKGGEFECKHETIKDEQNPNGCSWVAFYTDVGHSVNEVTEGARVVMNFSLHVEGSMCPSSCLPTFPQFQQSVLFQFLKGKEEGIAIPLVHSYTESSLRPALLKGRDAIMFNALQTSGLQGKLSFVFQVEKTIVFTCIPPDDPYWQLRHYADDPMHLDYYKETEAVYTVAAGRVTSFLAAIEEKERNHEACIRAVEAAAVNKLLVDADEICHPDYLEPEMEEEFAFTSLGSPELLFLPSQGWCEVWSGETYAQTEWLGNQKPAQKYFYIRGAILVKKPWVLCAL